MTDLMNIGRSGLAAYRSALTVTSENIANAETDGYVKRTAVMREAGVTGGVEIVNIERGYDVLSADRNRTAQTAVAASETYLTHMKTLENRLLPGTDGVSKLLDGFFDAVDSVSLSPSDTGLRRATISAADTLAGGISDLATGLDALAKGVQGEITQAVSQANATLEDLSEVQYRLGQVGNPGAQNTLVDQRDRLLDRLGSLVQIDVTMDERNLATVRLGTDGGGPVLASGASHARLTGDATGKLTVIPSDPDAPKISRMAVGGVLGGLSQAAGTIGQAMDDLDGWATLIATQVNAAHAQGVTSDGKAGGMLFSATGWEVSSGALMRGSGTATVNITDATIIPDGPLTLVFDAPLGSWQLSGNSGAVLSSGNPNIDLPGLSIEISGTPMDGDRMTLTRQDGSARHMAFQVTDPAMIATAGALTVSTGAANQGTAKLGVEPVQSPPTAVADLSTQLTGSTTEFIKSGVIGMIPSGSSAVDLSVQPRLASFEAAVAAGVSLQSLDVTLAGSTASFRFPAGLDSAGAAAMLNKGQVLSTEGQSLSDLGIIAQSSEGVLALSVREGRPAPQLITVGTDSGLVDAQPVADASPAGALSVFTRDGRQLSGPPLDPAAAAALLTPENGFDPQAVYVTDYLAEGVEFAGLTKTETRVGGDFVALAGGTGGIEVWSQGMRPSEAPLQTLSFEGEGVAGTVTLPEGTNAAWRARILTAELPLDVKAETRMSLALPDTGTLSLRLAGDNVNAIPVTADLGSGGATALATALNALTPSTGIRAEVTAGRITLIHSDGADITVSQLSHSGGSPVDVSRLAPDGAVLGFGSISTTGDQSIRVAGTVTLSGSTAFGFQDGVSLIEAAQDPMTGGMFDVGYGAGRRVARVALNDPAADDMALRSLAITGGDGRLLIGEANTAVTDADTTLAQTMLADLRSGAPASRLTGAALAALPPDGSVMRVSLGDESYSIRMTAGAPMVTGPEAGHVSAYFDASNSLVIETEGGTLDGTALRLPPDAGDAARFGMGVAQGAVTTVIGQPFDGANLPSSFVVRVGGVEHSISVSVGGIIMPPTFPGTGRINTIYGTIEIQFDARAGDFSIPAQQGAADVGLDTADLRATLENGSLLLTATDGRALNITSPATGSSGTGLQLTDLPDTDLLVVLSGDGALRLSGQLGPEANANRPQEVRVLDAEKGLVGLFDRATGAQFATRTLDADRSATFGGFEITLSGAAQTGDRFTLTRSSGAGGDARAIEGLANLRQRNDQTGMGGYGILFASIQQRVGTQVNAAQMRVDTTVAEQESAQLAFSAQAGVDLDAEAARLMQQQQAYQANAQILTTAREIFDTLLSAI